MAGGVPPQHRHYHLRRSPFGAMVLSYSMPLCCTLVLVLFVSPVSASQQQQLCFFSESVGSNTSTTSRSGGAPHALLVRARPDAYAYVDSRGAAVADAPVTVLSRLQRQRQRLQQQQLPSRPRVGSGDGGSGDDDGDGIAELGRGAETVVEVKQAKEMVRAQQQEEQEMEQKKEGRWMEKGRERASGARLCVGKSRLFDAVLETQRRTATAATVQKEEPPAELVQACTCAAASFICRANPAVVGRFTRQSGQPVTKGGGSAPAVQASIQMAVDTACGAPCEVPDVCDGVGNTEDACVGPVCDQVCAACVGAAAEAAGTLDMPFLHLLDACGKDDVCLCAHCLESGLLTQTPAPAQDLASAPTSASAPASVPTTRSYGKFGYYGGGGDGTAEGQVSRRSGGFGAGPSFGPYAGYGGPYPGGYPGYSYPAGALGWYQPWVVTVYDSTQAFIVSSLCYWHPFHPSCPPPLLPIVQTLRAIPEYSTLVAAIRAAGLVDVLSGPGPFTAGVSRSHLCLVPPT